MTPNRLLFLWTVTLFLGGSLLFRTLLDATEGSSAAVRYLVQLGALAVLIAGVVLVVRRLDRSRGD